MDTNITSPNRSALLTDIFSAAVAVGAVFLAVGSMTGIAEAQTAPKPTATVSYADLDLATHDGARALLKRINVAAKEACGPAPVMSPLTPAAPTLHERCITEAAGKAVAEVNAPLVVALHTGAPQPAGELFAAR